MSMNNQYMKTATVSLSLKSLQEAFNNIREMPLEPEITFVSYDYWKWYEEHIIRRNHGREKREQA